MKRNWLVAALVGLGLGVVGLGTALAVVVATDDDPGTPASASGSTFAGCQMAWGMMAGRGNWTPESMRSYMQSTLGADGYQAMLDHMRAHINGQDPSGYRFDSPMHGMMDAMMGGWSRDDWDRCWGWMMR